MNKQTIPLRKTFEGEPLFPFELVYRMQRSPEGELPDHLHDRYELVYVHEGRGTLLIDHMFFEQLPGDLFVIPGNTIHRGLPSAEQPVVSTALFFSPALVEALPASDGDYSPLRCFRTAAAGRFKLALRAGARREVEAELSRMHEETVRRLPGYRTAVRLHLERLLLIVNRLMDSNEGSPPGATGGAAAHHRVGPPWLAEALRAIDRAPERHRSLAELAAQANVSPPHFAREFKRYTGMTVTAYVNAKRIIAAKMLLADGRLSVAEVAERCGFASVPHFHRTFKSLMRATPGSCRR